jgi:diguanylate cyclase (GGDEF)-like protein
MSEGRAPIPRESGIDIPGIFLDDTTELPSRDYSIDQLRGYVDHFPGQFAFVFIDLDGLKEINDELGHKAGDMMLANAAKAVRSATRHHRENLKENDRIAIGGRLGGDEFMLLLPGVTTPEGLEVVSGRLRRTLEGVDISASMGGCVHKPGQSHSELLEAADKLMYEDKQARKQKRFEDRLKAAPRHKRLLYTVGAKAVSRSGIKPPR